MSKDAILNGIEAEIERSSRFLEFVVEGRAQHKGVWSVVVDLPPNKTSGGLDEGLEGAAAWWPGPPKGGADVLAIAADEQTLHLRFATAPPPPAGGKILIYPPVFLEPLRAYWKDGALAKRSLEWLQRAQTGNRFVPAEALPVSGFPLPLRERQAQAFRLTGYDASFLWGPPGTGKTYTLGALVAWMLLQRPKARVLLLSTTNTATDQALVSVDRTLAALGAAALRRSCARIGNHFVGANYVGREHLIPVKDETLVKRLVEIEARRPGPSDVQAYARWKEDVERVRALLKAQTADLLRGVRLAAMTTARAVFTLSELRAAGPWDLVVFDEASQVGAAHALALAPLGKRVLFAGDPQQLAPVTQSQHPDAARWLGESMFRYRTTGDNTCQLVEQSRMAEPICRIVSQTFYGGQLVVAAEKAKDRAWVAERRPPKTASLGAEHVVVRRITGNAAWSVALRGAVREASAHEACRVAQEIAPHVGEHDILVLTPFRAQRTIIKARLRAAGLREVSVSTVHRAQGGERNTVIFDPVDGASPFLQTAEAKRLLNVAISRAQSRLVLLLSDSDRDNPMIRQIATIVDNRDRTASATDIAPLARLPGFPGCLVGRTVRVHDAVGEVLRITDGGKKLVLRCFLTGTERKFLVAHLAQVEETA